VLFRSAADPRWKSVWTLQGVELRPAAAPPFLIEELGAPEPVKRLLSLIQEGREPAAMARIIERDDMETSTLLYGLALLGLVDAVPKPLAAPKPAPPKPGAPKPTAPKPAAPKPAARAVPAAPPARNPADVAAETRQLRERIQSLAGRIKTLSHYQVLGQTREADAASIKSSYITLAKEYHPDRFFRPGLEDLLEAVTTIFMHVNAAYTTLQDPAARAEYDREVLRLSSPRGGEGQTADDARLSEEQFAKGLALFDAGDAWSAIEALRWAVKLAPQSPRNHAALGAALLQTRKRLHEAEQHFKAAIALDGGNAQYYVQLGQVYRIGRLFGKAREQFEMALRLEPKHPVASQEIGELGGPPAEKRLLGRLRGT
jgi:curved DNA-binding protein CbpA